MTKVAIVTGASSGIGRCSAIALSKAGWSVVLTGRRLDALVETSQHCPSPTLVLEGDVKNEEFVEKLFTSTVQKFGRLDLLFNNAGTNGPQALFEDVSLEDFRKVLDVNVVGSFLCARGAFKVFKSQNPQGGRIINNGSLAAHIPRPHSSAYAISKHAISGLTKSTALDGRPYGITCTQIDIGNALTEMARAIGSNKGTLQPDGRLLKEPTFDVQHVADTIVHIASLPNEVTMLEVNIMATGAPYVGRG